MGNRSTNARQDPVTQASEFFVEFRAGDVTPAVRAQFERWLCASPEHIRAYLECAAGWSELPTADPDGLIDIQAVLAAAHDAQHEKVVRLELGQEDAPPPSRHHKRHRVLAGSLAVLLIVLAATGIWTVAQGRLTYKTGVGEQRTLILADGSTVTLNALTTVRVHITKEVRQITLVAGQAFFHDANDPAWPFVVRAGKSVVRAIGTEFNVDEQADRTVVTVLSGQVAVAESFASIDGIDRRELLRELAGPVNRLQAVLVPAGEQVTVLAQSVPSPNAVDVRTVTAWMQQRLVFDNTPLSKVAEQFNLYSKRSLVIADPSLRSVGVSGEYSASAPTALISFLRSQPTLHVVETDDRIFVSRSTGH